MTELPNIIRGTGYIAKRDGNTYIMDYLVGGHLPQESTEVLTLEEMRTIYEDPSKWNDVMVKIEMRRKNGG